MLGCCSSQSASKIGSERLHAISGSPQPGTTDFSPGGRTSPGPRNAQKRRCLSLFDVLAEGPSSKNRGPDEGENLGEPQAASQVCNSMSGSWRLRFCFQGDSTSIMRMEVSAKKVFG